MLLARNPLLSPHVASLGKAAQQNEGRHKLLRKIHGYAGYLQFVILQGRLTCSRKTGRAWDERRPDENRADHPQCVHPDERMWG